MIEALPAPKKSWWKRLKSPATDPPGVVWHLGWLAVCAVLLVAAFITKDEGSRNSLFWFVTVIALASGLGLAELYHAIERRRAH